LIRTIHHKILESGAIIKAWQSFEICPEDGTWEHGPTFWEAQVPNVESFIEGEVEIGELVFNGYSGKAIMESLNEWGAKLVGTGHLAKNGFLIGLYE